MIEQMQSNSSESNEFQANFKQLIEQITSNFQANANKFEANSNIFQANFKQIIEQISSKFQANLNKFQTNVKQISSMQLNRFQTAAGTCSFRPRSTASSHC
jgi:hypothetical protein